MSTAPINAAQNPIPFPWTQGIWNQAWKSDNGSSLKSLCCKIACIVFPIIFTVALAEGVLWIARSIQQVINDPKKASLNPQPVQKNETDPSVNIVKIDDNPVTIPNRITGILNNGSSQQEAVSDPKKASLNPQPVQKNEIDPPVNIVTIDDNPVKIPNRITLILNNGSSQHDIENNPNDPTNLKPAAADTLHALHAAYYISRAFHKNFSPLIESRDVGALSELQRSYVVCGMKDYFLLQQHLAWRDPTWKENINPGNSVCSRIFLYKNLYFEPINQDTKPVDERTRTIVEHLFIPEDPQAKPEHPLGLRNIAQIAWIKSGNGEAFTAICDANKTIVFNSHKNEITMTYGKEQTLAYLTEILQPFAKVENGIDANPFSYALGQFNNTIPME